MEFTEQNLINNKWIEKKYTLLLENADAIMVYSRTFKGNKKMTVYRAFAFENYLIYVFEKEEKKVELLYKGNFAYNKKLIMLSFKNEDVK